MSRNGEPKSMSCVVDKGHVEGAEMHSRADISESTWEFKCK